MLSRKAKFRLVFYLLILLISLLLYSYWYAQRAHISRLQIRSFEPIVYNYVKAHGTLPSSIEELASLYPRTDSNHRKVLDSGMELDLSDDGQFLTVDGGFGQTRMLDLRTILRTLEEP